MFYSGCVTIPISAIARSETNLAALTDIAVLSGMRDAVTEQRRWESEVARYSAEIARRSRPELGHDGLAQRTGARTATDLVQRFTGRTRSGARTTLMVGEILTGGTPWLAPVAEAVMAGEISADAASAIRGGLGEPGPAVAGDDLADAARDLLEIAPTAAPEVTARHAREARALLDETSVADRERALRDRRFLRLIPQIDGMTRVIGLLDPESAALVGDVVDQVTSPRRGGPRFVDSQRRAVENELVRDERSTEQLVCDAVVDLIRIGASAEPGRVYAPRSPEVRMHIMDVDFGRRGGHGVLEDSGALVSTATVERRACLAGIQPILFESSGTVLELGRTQRLFSSAQKRALAAEAVHHGRRGCAAPGCERPPSWCESHHIVPWSRGGVTDVRNGVLLCRHHHLLAHDRNWIIRRGADGRIRVTIPADDRVSP